MRTAADIGLEGGAIVARPHKYMIYTGFLSLEGAKAILTDFQKRLIAFPDGAEAARMIGEISERIADKRMKLDEETRWQVAGEAVEELRRAPLRSLALKLRRSRQARELEGEAGEIN